jgi:class 3 adenylate cyclase
MREAVARRDALLGDVIGDHGGVVFSTVGDGLAAAFQTASAAVLCAIEAQSKLHREAWETVRSLRVRMGLHTGKAEERGSDYFGTAVNRAARLAAVGHGGQIICSSATAEVSDSDIGLVDLGEHRLRGPGPPDARLSDRGRLVSAPAVAEYVPREPADPVDLLRRPPR